MPNTRKVNDNGATPNNPNAPSPGEKDLEAVLREEQEDAQLRDAKRAKSEGLQEGYTKAPWLKGGWD